MTDREKAEGMIERAMVLYDMKDELQQMANNVKANDMARYGANTGSYKTDFMLKLCEMMELLISEATKVKRTVK